MMDKAVASAPPLGNVDQQPSDELSLEQARAIVGSMTFFSDKLIIGKRWLSGTLSALARTAR